MMNSCSNTDLIKVRAKARKGTNAYLISALKGGVSDLYANNQPEERVGDPYANNHPEERAGDLLAYRQSSRSVHDINFNQGSERVISDLTANQGYIRHIHDLITNHGQMEQAQNLNQEPLTPPFKAERRHRKHKSLNTMKKLLTLLFAIVLLISCNRKSDDTGKDITVPVTVREIKPGRIEKFIDITGAVQPIKEATLKSEITGNYILKINPATGKPYVLGDKAEVGAEIVEFEDKEFENNIKLNSLKLNLDITKQVYDKQQSLYDKGGVTLSELKNAEINFINASYNYEDALFRLQKMHVKAPFTGVIIDLPYYTPGVKVDANVLLVKIMDYSKLLMEINLPEKNIGETKPGQIVRVTNYTLPNDTLIGTVTQLSPAIDAETRSYKGLIQINNPKLRLRPGMFVKGEIVVATSDNTIVVRKDIIVSKQHGNSVFVVEKGIAYERIVEFGLENPQEVQIVSGLKVNEQLVVKGFETLRDHSKVKEMK
jgi:membrane fusion protein (multidrug efflux system)